MAIGIESLMSVVERLCGDNQTTLAQELLNMPWKGLGLHESGGVVRIGRNSMVCSVNGNSAHHTTATTCDCGQYEAHTKMRDMGLVDEAQCGCIYGHRVSSGNISETAIYELAQWAEDHAQEFGLNEPSKKMMDKRTEASTAVAEAIAAKAKRRAAQGIAAIRFQCKSGTTIGGRPYHDMLNDVTREQLLAVWCAASAKWPHIKGLSHVTVTQAEAANLVPVSKGLPL